jgi:4-amino-4-deoxy-L-arabinose transferase-like glycosyltransferase
MTPTRRWTALSALLIVIAMVRIASTYRVYSATVDEATHTGAGLELFQHHRYDLQIVNPPLPRVIFSAIPYARGMRIDTSLDFAGTLRSVFYSRGDYVTNVASARVGNLPFFILACAAVWWLARRALGDTGAFVALFLFTFQPIVLGHSGLVTHDAAATAGLAVALVAFQFWLEKPSVPRAAILGAAYGFSALCKFACVPDVPLACAAIFAVRIAADSKTRQSALRALETLLVVPLTTFLIVWAGHAFTVGTFEQLEPWRNEFGRAAAWMLERVDPATPLPAPHFFKGIGELLRLDRQGHLSYLFGRSSTDGFWWYFPAAIALKTPLAFLALASLGFIFTWKMHELRAPFLESFAAAAAIVVYAFTTRLDLGVRYVLPAYVPLTLAAAAAAMAMLGNARRTVRVTALLLVGAHGVASMAAHPDYFPYFNILAGREPSRYLIDSNLDWGQDVLRLRKVLREERIERVGLSLMGPADFDALAFPPWYHLHPWIPTAGWLAVSEHSYRFSAIEGGWDWLRNRPYRRVGTSIRLYYMP